MKPFLRRLCAMVVGACGCATAGSGSSIPEDPATASDSLSFAEEVQRIVLDGTGALVEGPDTLLRVDRRGRSSTSPDASLAASSREHLAVDDPDERILHLRNLAWADPDARRFVARELIRVLEERDEGSPFAVEQAMDGVIWLRDASVTSLLVGMLDDGRWEIPAAMALDRLAAANPAEVMRTFNEDRSLLEDRPLLRADYFSKANPDDPIQKQELERHLGDETIPLAAREKVIRGLVQPGRILSPGIFTGGGLLDSHAAGRRTAIRRVFEEWCMAEALWPLHGVIREELAQGDTGLPLAPEEEASSTGKE